MKEMREELNANLLRKIKYWESGELFSKVVFGALLLGIILYFIAGKVYIPISHIIKEKKLCLKKKRIQKGIQKRKKKIRFWFVLIISGGMITGSGYSSCYVKAAVITKEEPREAEIIDQSIESTEERTVEKGIDRTVDKTVERTTESIADKIEEDTNAGTDADVELRTNPRLKIYSKGWKEGKGDFFDYLFSKEDTSLTLELEENIFDSNSEQEQFLFQVSEKGDNSAESSVKIKNYEKKDFGKSENNDEEESLYQKILKFQAEEGKERLYNIHLKYLNMWGMSLISATEQENKYGEITAGTFKSRNMVIDKKCPEIEDIYIKKVGDIGNTVKQTYYSGAVSGIINVKEEYLDWDLVHIWAVPLDEDAKKLTESKKEENNQDVIDISSWKHTRKKDFVQISFDFFMEGKWKFCFSCADMAGNKGIYTKTGGETAESEEFIIDNTAPELSVSYAEFLNIMNEPFSIANVNKKIQNNDGKVTSSGNQIFTGKENEVTIQIKESNIDLDDIEIKIYRVVYKADGEMKQTELSEEELYNKKIERKRQETLESRAEQRQLRKEQEQSEAERQRNQWKLESGAEKAEGVFIYSIKNLEEGHYKIVIRCKDKAGNTMTALKNSETDKCISDGAYESPLYTVDTESPITTEASCNQKPVRIIGNRQYFRNAPKIIIRIQEENFNRSNFLLSGQLFYASGKMMKQEWERIKERVENLQWKSYYKNGVRVNEASIDISIEANYLLHFQCVDGAAHIGSQKDLAFTYDCTKPEIVYTGENNLNEDLIFRPETQLKTKIQLEAKTQTGLRTESMVEKGAEIESKTSENLQTNFFTFRRYSFFRYFSKKRMYVSIRIKDEISGVEKINYKFIPYGTTEKNTGEWIVAQNTKLQEGLVQSQMQTQTQTQTEIQEQDLSELVVIALPEQENFRGYLKTYGQDCSGNIGKVINSKGMVSEDEKLHRDMSGITIKMPKPVFTDKEKKIRYYNKSIPVNATFEDRQSGILKAILSGKMMELPESLSAEKVEANLKKEIGIQAEDSIVWDAENVVHRQQQRIVLEAEKFQQSDVDHPLIIQGKMTDNVGHMSEERFDKKLVIDTIKPEIKVEYDNNNETGYYNTPRKATVIIKERNFNPDFVKWDIKGSNQNYRIGEWRTTKRTSNTETNENAGRISNTETNKNADRTSNTETNENTGRTSNIEINKKLVRQTDEQSDKKNIENIHYCDIYFEEDGEDYAVNLSVSDYAGNKAEWKDRGYFTIDRTVPALSIKIDGEENFSVNEDKQTDEIKYFNKAKEIVFCIQDKNFDKDNVEYNIQATEEEKAIKIKKPENYIREGDRYYSKLTLKKEAQYHIQAKCMDKAGNESEKKELTFIIDTTKPEIIVKGVENDTTYDGKVIMPEVICADKYLDLSSVKVRLVRANGKVISKKEWNYEYVENEKTEGDEESRGNKENKNSERDKKDREDEWGKKDKKKHKKAAKIEVQFLWENLPEKKVNDGIYQLQIWAKDKAGNKAENKIDNKVENKVKKGTKDGIQITFRVNRWGTNFILDDNLKNKIDGHYLNTVSEFKLKEQCVKRTKSTVIILKDNEERRTIGKEEVKERIIADKKSERYGWYERVYTIRKNNFQEEGDYRVTFQADSKKKEIHFVVDKTPPVVSINGLESDIYEEKEHEFQINIMDNYAFEKMELYVGKNRSTASASETRKIIIRPEDLDENHMFSQRIKESTQKQTIYYIAWDKAGNIIDSDENKDTRTCLVTSNKALKEYYKYKDSYIRIAVIGIAVVAVLFAGAYIDIKYIMPYTRMKRNT